MMIQKNKRTSYLLTSLNLEKGESIMYEKEQHLFRKKGNLTIIDLN